MKTGVDRPTRPFTSMSDAYEKDPENITLDVKYLAAG
jgi:hypothetical protein